LDDTLAAEPSNNTLQTMDTQEFYIRQASDNEASGPYNLEQRISLCEIGAVSFETGLIGLGSVAWYFTSN
jgi:hypothetical protein